MNDTIIDNYESAAQRMQAQTTEALGTILAAGEMEGHWTIDPLNIDASLMNGGRVRYVATKDGARFEFIASPGAILCELASIGTWGQPDYITPRQAINNAPQPQRDWIVPTARQTVKPESSPITLMRSFVRRMTTNPAALEIARLMTARQRQVRSQREMLLSMICELEGQGFRISNGELSREAYEVTMYGPAPVGTVRVNASGNLYVERITVHYTLLGKLEALLNESRALDDLRKGV